MSRVEPLVLQVGDEKVLGEWTRASSISAGLAQRARIGVTHWPARLLADHLGISFATVAWIWRRWGLQPWKAATFKFSTDPAFEAKIRGRASNRVTRPCRMLWVAGSAAAVTGQCLRNG